MVVVNKIVALNAREVVVKVDDICAEWERPGKAIRVSEQPELLEEVEIGGQNSLSRGRTL